MDLVSKPSRMTQFLRDQASDSEEVIESERAPGVTACNNHRLSMADNRCNRSSSLTIRPKVGSCGNSRRALVILLVTPGSGL